MLSSLLQFYTCEICSGESYRGRRNFELHFADQKHAVGMKSVSCCAFVDASYLKTRMKREHQLIFLGLLLSLSDASQLGIPNTKHFHGVTKIQDAKDLWEALQEKLKKDQFDTSKDEQFEDSNGNVLSRTTYEDLARQGLL